MNEPNGKLLIGSQQIMTYLGISKNTFYKFLKLGLPAIVVDNRWYAWSDNLDEYFKTITRKIMKDVPEDAE